MDKKQLRKLVIKQRDALDQRLKQSWEEQILDQFFALDQYSQATNVMVYLPFGSEFNTWPLVYKAWEDGKDVLVPKMAAPAELEAVKIASKEDLQPAKWGILEPKKGEVIPPSQIRLIVVPGLAFNSSGYRLGYGGGYYDNFLGKTPGSKVGFCFRHFLREDIPIDEWDQPVDLVLTEEK